MKLQAETDVKLGSHQGQFTRSYLEARAIYDMQIRNWEIEYKDSLFEVTDSDKKTEKVYIDAQIKNCSCKWFLENQCGTCMHVEAAIQATSVYDVQYEVKRPIVYLNDNYEVKQRGGPNGFWTPAVKPYLHMVDNRTVHPTNINIDSFDIFDGISFFDFQKHSIERMVKFKRTVLALKMGLGKTLCALAACKILDKERVLIVAPNNLKFQWEREIKRFNLGETLVIAKGNDTAKIGKEKFLIISYEMLNRHRGILNRSYDVAIVDEIHKVKNGESITWETISKIKSDFMFTLSGTPVQNNINDLVSIINIINPYELKPEWKFYSEFCLFSKAKMYGIKREKITELVQRFAKYIINPKIDASQFSLPSKTEETIVTEMTEAQYDTHDAYMSIAQPLLAKSHNYALTFAEKATLNGVLTKARLASLDERLVGGTGASKRLEAIQDKIKELVDAGKSVVVYSEWIKALELLKPFLNDNKISYVDFNSDVSAKKRDKNLLAFIQKEVKVFLSTDSGGVGIDGLQHASCDMIHLEPLWNPKRIEQRNGRLVRTLQKSPNVNIFYYKSNSAVEMLIESAVDRKTILSNDLLDAVQ